MTAVADSGQMTYNEVEEWLNNELTPYYSTDNTRTINFGNWVEYLCRNN